MCDSQLVHLVHAANGCYIVIVTAVCLINKMFVFGKLCYFNVLPLQNLLVFIFKLLMFSLLMQRDRE